MLIRCRGPLLCPTRVDCAHARLVPRLRPVGNYSVACRTIHRSYRFTAQDGFTRERHGPNGLEDRGLEAFRCGGVPAYAQVRRAGAISSTHWAPPKTISILPSGTPMPAHENERKTALEEKVAHYDPGALQMAVSPSFDDLHQDPRFLALLAHIGLRVPTCYPKPLLDAWLK
jgi:hypothetical protein